MVFWDPNDISKLWEWKECMVTGSNPLPNPTIKLIAEAGSLIFIPPGWPHAVHTSQRSIGICGSLLTIESLHHVSKRWEWSRSLYSEDQIPAFDNIKDTLGRLFGFSTQGIDSKLQSLNLLFDESLKSYNDIVKVGSKRGRKPRNQNIQRPKPKVKFGPKPHGDKQCQDPEHDPSKRCSCGKSLSSFSYGFLLSPICAPCYQRNHKHRHFHVPMLPLADN